MAVYLITMHAYRSWLEDNPAGYFQRNEHGVKPPNPDLANRRAHMASQPPHRFSPDQMQLLIEQSLDILANRQVRLYAASCTPTHLHLLTGWLGKEDCFTDLDQPMSQAKQLADKTKNILATLLSKQDCTTGRRWFSRGADCTPVENREHFNHLVEVYLPKHVHERGIVKIFDQGNTTKL